MMWLALVVLGCAVEGGETAAVDQAPVLTMHTVTISNTADPQEVIVPGFGWTVKWAGVTVEVDGTRVPWEGDATEGYEVLDGHLCEKGYRVADCRLGNEHYDLVVTWFSYE